MAWYMVKHKENFTFTIYLFILKPDTAVLRNAFLVPVNVHNICLRVSYKCSF